MATQRFVKSVNTRPEGNHRNQAKCSLNVSAAENLVGYSSAQPSLFKRNQLEPISDLKLLIKDYTPISKNALTMLINVSDDEEVLKCLVDDEKFVEDMLRKITVRLQRPICHLTTTTN